MTSKPKQKTKKARAKQKAKALHVLCRLPDPTPMPAHKARTYAIYPGMSGAYINDRRDRAALAFIQRDDATGVAILPACDCAAGTCSVMRKVMTQVNRLGIEGTSYIYVKAVRP